MANSPLAVWSVFLSGILVALVLLAGFVAAVVVSQRRYLSLHRSHARKILETQEEERAWVSREVHEGAVQWVGVLGRECEALMASAPQGDSSRRLAAIREQLRDLGEFLRGVAHRVHPPIIDRGGLVAALFRLAEEMERAHGLEVECELPPADSVIGLPREAAIAVYRIAQEALQNVVKHSESRSVTIDLARSERVIELVVRDRGRGFEPGATRERGIGLLSMKERAILAGGAVTVQSAKGEGTEVRARIPLTESGLPQAAMR
jgi:signal transduction histidine kinase